ncbi:MAG: T9SS type A sorting domain-containing protein [Sphingobacteriales bacterium JAD_PAG50586_3]|nr:MAG: T9SS type A sorting domain-containing protein [Sphingobacteriales bacterium JAD_PAG50586_3]
MAGANAATNHECVFPKLNVDTLPLRPFILIIHGGGFVSGNKEDWNNDCREFAKRGFVAATIDYRLGLTGNCAVDSFSYDKAVYRAVQDAKAALRFAVENAAVSRIDTSWMFINGGSAGAATSLGVLYLSQDEWNNYSPTIPQTLGPLNTSGNTLTNSFTLKGIMNNWGAIGKDFIQPDEMVPMIAFHGDADSTVDIDSAFANSCVNPPLVYGSRSLYTLFTNAGTCADLSVKIGGGHGVYRYNGNNFRIDRTACFFKSVMCNTCTNFYSTDSIPANCSLANGINDGVKQSVFTIYPNPSGGDINLSFALQGQKQVAIYNALGQLVSSFSTTNATHSLTVAQDGLYFVRVECQNRVSSSPLIISQ